MSLRTTTEILPESDEPAISAGLCRIRTGGVSNLREINAIIESAIAAWPVGERVRRQATVVHRYSPHDLMYMETALAVVQDAAGAEEQVVGVATLEPVDESELPDGRSALRLHGLYVRQEAQGMGYGTALLHWAAGRTRDRGYDGLLVKASANAASYFRYQRLSMLAVEHPERDYPYRFWLPHDGLSQF